MATTTKKPTTKKSAAAKKVSTAAQMKTKKQPTSAEEWKAQPVQGVELEVPSGHVALVRPVGMQAFLQKGLIPNALREIAMESIKQKKTPDISMITDMNEKQLNDMFEMVDGVTVFCVVAPKVWAVPHYAQIDAANGLCTEEQVGTAVPFDSREEWELARNPDIKLPKLYVDEVDLDDKMFIFQFACGGTADLESFREEYRRNMERLSRESDLADQA